MGASAMTTRLRKTAHHRIFQGLLIHIEHDRGDTRRGTSPDGTAWRTTMSHPYGEIVGTLAVDGDPLDVFIGPNPHATHAYVIASKLPGSPHYDESKIMLGWDTQEAAVAAFRANYDRPGFFLDVTRWPMAAVQDLVHQHRDLQGGKLDGAKLAAVQARALRKGLPGVGSLAKMRGLLKAHVKAHPRKLWDGRVVMVDAHERLDRMPRLPEGVEHTYAVHRDLVAQWHAADPATRPHLERAMRALGLVQRGERWHLQAGKRRVPVQRPRGHGPPAPRPLDFTGVHLEMEHITEPQVREYLHLMGVDQRLVTPGSIIRATGSPPWLGLDGQEFEIHLEGPRGADGLRDLSYLVTFRPAKKRVGFDVIRLPTEMRGGHGTVLAGRMVNRCRAAGYSAITLQAAGYAEGKENGYYTWPRLGWDADLESWEHGGGWRPRPPRSQWPPEARGARRLSDLVANPVAREWWRAHGSDVSATFDLAPTSLSSQVLDAYLGSRGMRDMAKSRRPDQRDIANPPELTPEDEAELDRIWDRIGRERLRKGKRRDILPGGKGDDLDPEDVDPEALKQGEEHEREHTDDPRIAREIALDHLASDSDYYDRLEAMERRAKKARRMAKSRFRALVEAAEGALPRSGLLAFDSELVKAAVRAHTRKRKQKDGSVVEVQVRAHERKDRPAGPKPKRKREPLRLPPASAGFGHYTVHPHGDGNARLVDNRTGEVLHEGPHWTGEVHEHAAYLHGVDEAEHHIVRAHREQMADENADRQRRGYQPHHPTIHLQLEHIRARLPDLKREHVDAALQRLSMGGLGHGHLRPNENTKAITPEGHAAAVPFGSKPHHLLRIDHSKHAAETDADRAARAKKWSHWKLRGEVR